MYQTILTTGIYSEESGDKIWGGGGDAFGHIQHLKIYHYMYNYGKIRAVIKGLNLFYVPIIMKGLNMNQESILRLNYN